MLSQGVSYNLRRYAVKGLPQVEEGDMHSFLFLVVLLYQEADEVYSINSATASHKAALIAGKLNDVTNSSVNNTLRDLHAARKQANWTVTGAVCRTVLHPPDLNRRSLAPTVMRFLLCYYLIKNFDNQPAGDQYFDFHRSLGPVALPGLIFIMAACVSSTVIF
ncbi:unnamed protein product [Heligmosomoides polygyrus]|uniref:Peroxisomal membrane protein PEX16 n=1 Tax=Heligmosomoides polygyrus TaxID=6339 RepID=A0A183G1U4_HELPZ|nr:unnamed protein product [Heligmosomoides polygyrus]